MSFIHLEFENQATKQLMNIAGRQVPFALTLALTKTAQNAQRNIRNHIDETFVIRKKSGGFKSSIRISPATKNNLTATVYSMAGFASLQQTGGQRTAHGGRLAIPAYDSIKNVKRTTNKNSPAGYLADGGFILRLKAGGQAIAKRYKGSDLRILYFLRKEADVPKRLEMIETTHRTVGDDFAMLFNKTLRDVMTGEGSRIL